jgi:hypothetical protein
MVKNCFLVFFSYTKLPDDPGVRWREEIVSETILQVIIRAQIHNGRNSAIIVLFWGRVLYVDLRQIVPYRTENFLVIRYFQYSGVRYSDVHSTVTIRIPD